MEPESLIQSYIDSHTYDLAEYQPDFTDDRRAVLVETRPLPTLLWTIRNVAYHTRWPVTVFCSENNESLLNTLEFPVEKVRIDQISWQNYTWALVNNTFWSLLPEHVLIFQTDAFMLRPGVNNYLDYDYVGAPWAWAYANEKMRRFRYGGNGGFSLRKTSVMKKIIETWPYESICNHAEFHLADGMRPPEDMYFAFGLSEMKANVPGLREQMQFSVETIPYPSPLAVHSIERQLSAEQISTILSY